MSHQPPASSVQDVMDRMIAGYAANDVETIMSCYEPDAAYVLEPGALASGANDLRRLFESLLSMSPQFEFMADEVIVAGDVALHLSAYDARRPGGGVHRGISVAVLRRQASGDWLMAIDHPAAQRVMG